ncbi:MAG TPA: histidine kinase [Verrucomicrobiae bacterium]|nr:histidine kinase [Verrucomicrobiae bacterium]
MKFKLIALSKRYAVVLSRHLKQGTNASLRPALRMGSQAAVLGLETLGLARIHEQALATLGLTHIKNTSTKLAGTFFAEANTLIEDTHHAARQSRLQITRLTDALDRRTEELAASNRQVQRGAARHKLMADAFKKSGKARDKSLQESLGFQKRLRQLTHKVLVAQEDERKKISKELQDEIAQTLLGINVRLLSLKQEARGNTHGIKRGIASTQMLVASSGKAVRRMAGELRRLRVLPT